MTQEYRKEYRIWNIECRGGKGILFLVFLYSTFNILHSPCFAQPPTGASFLKIPVGARAAGMGSAITALVDDANGLYWNPAGIGRIGITDILASHNEWVADTREESFALAQRLAKSQVIGISYLTLTMDPMDRRSNTGEKLGTFTASDRATGVTWAMNFSRYFSIGATAKKIEQRLDKAVAKGTAADFGIQIRPVRRIYLGASLLNVGSPMKYINEEYSLPTMARGGLAIRLTRTLTLAVEGKQEMTAKNKPADFAAGFEWNLGGLDRSYFWSPVVWRIGYLSPAGPGAGLGIKIFGARLDYAIAPMAELGLTHRASINLRFGKKEPAVRSAENPSKTKSSDKKASKDKETDSEEKKSTKTGTLLDVLF
ncbi:MAG: PorV/PorQ family protein [Elusimicrobia bacterium]|nr:PorV/PorQ family protein [Elusimicrobiota bacterium]